MTPTGDDPAARRAISDAATRLGHDDPVSGADELVAVDVGALRAWCTLTGTARHALSAGSDVLAEALPLLGGGWSSPAPRQAVERQRRAGLSARDVLGRQIDAAREVVGVLESARTSAHAALARAVTRIRGTGWPPGEDLLTWACTNGRLAEVTEAVGGLSDTVRDLRGRNDGMLQTLADALRADPAEPVDLATAALPTAAGGAAGTVPGVAADGVGPERIDQQNLDRLAADLASADITVVAAAMGVRAALDLAGPDAQLLIYESAGATSQGRAAIGIGDITTADTVVTMAPGVSSSLTDMSDGIVGLESLRTRTSELAPHENTAVIAWYGYEVPLAAFGGSPMAPLSMVENTAAAVNDLHARAGGQLLVDDLATFRAWAPDDARFVGMGFSMGSTTVSAAAARGAGFDDLVLLGSPGAGIDVRSAADYPGLTPEHVWVAAHDDDPITTRITDTLASVFSEGLLPNPLQPSPFGPDPADADFGARLLDVPSNAPDFDIRFGGMFGPLISSVGNTFADLRLHHQEANYLSGPSLDAVASIVVGNYDDVPLRHGR